MFDSVDFVVLYASETGTAEDVAFKICSDGTRKGYSCLAMNVVNFPTEELQHQKRVIFVVSTTGDGEMVADMKAFWKPLLRKKLTQSYLSSVQVAVFGLGDSGYEKFNSAARKLSVRLGQLGAREILPIGLGDDQANYGFYTDFSPWLYILWKRLHADVHGAASATSTSEHQEAAPPAPAPAPAPAAPLPPPPSEAPVVSSAAEQGGNALPWQYALDVTPVVERQLRDLRAGHPLEAALQQIHHPNCEATAADPAPSGLIEVASVEANVAMTSERWASVQEVRHIDIRLPKIRGVPDRQVDDEEDGEEGREPPRFVAGDVAAVYPGNSDEVIARLLALLVSRSGAHSGVGANTAAAGPVNAQERLYDQLLAESKFIWVKAEPTVDCPVTKNRLLGFANTARMTQKLFHSAAARDGGVTNTSAPTVSCSLYDLLKFVLNIQGIPRRSYFEFLSQFAAEVEERDKLIELSSPEGTDLYYDFCIKESRNYVEILEDFRSVRMDPASSPACGISSADNSVSGEENGGLVNNPHVIAQIRRLMETVPVVQPRLYSIASSAKVTGRHMHLCVGIVRYKTRYNRPRMGICSSYLTSLVPPASANEAPKPSIFVSIRKGVYSALHNNSTSVNGNSTTSVASGKTPVPLILVGPGTGIAPIRGIVQERVLAARASAAPSTSTDTVVFYGCRKRDDDCLYKEEWLSMPNDINGTIDQYSASAEKQCIIATVAYSQERSTPLMPYTPAVGQGNPLVEPVEPTVILGKTYVTHKIRQYGALLWPLIQQGAIIFVAGSAKRMPMDVRKAIVDVVAAHATPCESVLGVAADAEGGERRAAADRFVTMHLERQHRYIVEAWS